MTVKELKKELKHFSENADIIIACKQTNRYYTVDTIGEMATKNPENNTDIVCPVIMTNR